MSNSQQSTGDIPGAFNPSSTLSNATTSSISSNAALRSATATPPPRVTSPAITSAGLLSPPITSRTTPIQTSSNSPKPGVNYPVQALNAFENYKKKDSAKVVVRFKATGNAPIMKNNYFRITAFNRFQAVIQFLRKELGWKQGDALFLYINSSFSPAPDDTVGNLFRCFGTEGHLIVNYSTQAAWG